jgi:hypothetical protein
MGVDVWKFVSEKDLFLEVKLEVEVVDWEAEEGMKGETTG